MRLESQCPPLTKEVGQVVLRLAPPPDSEWDRLRARVWPASLGCDAQAQRRTAESGPYDGTPAAFSFVEANYAGRSSNPAADSPLLRSPSRLRVPACISPPWPERLEGRRRSQPDENQIKKKNKPTH